MIYHRVSRFRHHPEASWAPDPLVIAFAVQACEHLPGTGHLAHDSQASEQLQPVQGKGHVSDPTLRIRMQRVTQDFE